MVSLSIIMSAQKNVLKRFYMDEGHSLSTLIVILSLEVNEDSL